MTDSEFISEIQKDIQKDIRQDVIKDMMLRGATKEEVKKAIEDIYPGAMEKVRDLIRIIGDDPDREGLIDTPYRVVKSWLEIYGGYKTTPSLSTAFAEDIGDVDDSQIVICKDIKFYSTCEHHMIPFHGICHIGYLPNKKVIGVSKLVRIVEHFARRLQIQEKLCSQIADFIEETIGVKNQSSRMTTSQMRGKFRTQVSTRTEFLNLIK